MLPAGGLLLFLTCDYFHLDFVQVIQAATRLELRH